MKDITADFLAALAVVRLIGRPCAVEAAEVIRAALQDLMEKIPTQKKRAINMQLLAHKAVKSNQEREFAFQISTVGKTFNQFHSIVQSDHLERDQPWQIWRRSSCKVRSAEELLTEVRKDTSTSKE